LEIKPISLQTEGDEIPQQYKERAQKRANHKIKKLGLTEEEAVEFKAIHKKYREELKAAKANVTSKEEMAEIRYANHKVKTAEVKAFLTPEQYAIYDKFEPRKGRKGKAKRSQRGNREFKQKRKL